MLDDLTKVLVKSPITSWKTSLGGLAALGVIFLKEVVAPWSAGSAFDISPMLTSDNMVIAFGIIVFAVGYFSRDSDKSSETSGVAPKPNQDAIDTAVDKAIDSREQK